MIKRGAEQVGSGIVKVGSDLLGITDAARLTSRYITDNTESLRDKAVVGFVGAIMLLLHPIAPLLSARLSRISNPDVLENRMGALGMIGDFATLFACACADIVTDSLIVAMPPLGIAAKGLQMGAISLTRGIADQVRGDDIY